MDCYGLEEFDEISESGSDLSDDGNGQEVQGTQNEHGGTQKKSGETRENSRSSSGGKNMSSFYGKRSHIPRSRTISSTKSSVVRPGSTKASASSKSPAVATPKDSSSHTKSARSASTPSGSGQGSSLRLAEGVGETPNRNTVLEPDEIFGESPTNSDFSGHNSDSNNEEVISAGTKRRCTSPQQDPGDIEEMKAMLRTLCDKVDRNEKRLKDIKKGQNSSGPSGTSTKKRDIPLVVRQEVRKVYKALLDDSEVDFDGWLIRKGESIKSKENQVIITRLIKEIKGLNPSFNGADIRESAYRFYKTKCEEESLKRSGKADGKRTSRRRHERVIRKKKEREASVRKNSRLTDDQRQKWLAVMTNEFMSSEESGDDDTICVRPLQWRSSYVNQMFKKIDSYCASKKAPQARRQMKARWVGSPSLRPRPNPDSVPEWAVNQCLSASST